jgi:OmcA/MtrC family decaheme c-type cytochrome
MQSALVKSALVRFGAPLLLALGLVSCGGGGGGDGGGTTPPPVTTPSLKAAIAAAAADPANDSSIVSDKSSTAPFRVLQDANLPAVTVAGPPKVNFTLFSNGAVVPKENIVSASAIIAKLIPASGGNPDEWQTYTHRTRTPATAVAGRTYSDAVKATLDNPAYPLGTTTAYSDSPATPLVYNDDGYYTYTFSTDITDPTKTEGVVYEPARTHRVAVQVRYKTGNKNPDGTDEVVNTNPYFDFTVSGGNSVAVTDPGKTRKMIDVASCNSCHEKLALHGGGRIDTQYCVMCHNPGTINTADAQRNLSAGKDANSGNAITLATLVHKIHSARLLLSNWSADPAKDKGGERVTIRTDDFTEVGFPQDLRNCTKCHSGDNPSTPQGGNWEKTSSKQACLTCHANKAGSDWEAFHKPLAVSLVGPGAAAKDIPDKNCQDCHKPGTDVAPGRVHWNQNEENAAKYKMNIESAVFNDTADHMGRSVTVKYYLSDPTNGNAAYNLVTSDCTFPPPNICRPPTGTTNTKFGNLQFRVTWPAMVGQALAVTEYTAYNIGGNGAAAYAASGVNDGTNHYTATIPLPDDSANLVVQGTARVVSIGQIKEPQLEVKSATDPRPEVVPTVMISTVAQNTWKEFAISGTLNPRRQIVSTEKCNVCHGALGTTSGSNTLANAFHGGARNIVESCVVCHDPNRAGSNIMANGLPSPLIESYQMKRMIHGIHGNSKRTYPFTHGNKVNAAFGKDGIQLTSGLTALVSSSSVSAPAGTLFEPWLTGSEIPAGTPFASGVENYAAEVAWPGVGINCNACHVNNSYKVDQGPVGTVIQKPIDPATMKAKTDPKTWMVITPKAATCTACHDSSTAMGHVTSFGAAAFGNATQAQGWLIQETCADCHSSGGFKGVDIVHGQK